jgi:hypothetical protein
MMLEGLRPLIGAARNAGVLTAGVAAGLFVAHFAGEFVPDALANCVCMFAFGWLSGRISGLTQHRH